MIDSLSDSHLCQIFNHVPEEELYHLLFVQKRWQMLIKEPEFMVKRILPDRLIKLYCFRDKLPFSLRKEIISIVNLVNYATFNPEYTFAASISERVEYCDYLIDSKKLNTESVKELRLCYSRKSAQIDFADSYPSLRMLGLSGNIEWKNLPNSLRRLEISHMDKALSLDLSELPEGLEQLDIMPGCLSDMDFAGMPGSLQKLSLRISSCFTGMCLPGFKELSELNLFKCSVVRDSAIKRLPLGLISLRITSCSSITEQSVKHLSRLKKLKHLELADLNVNGSQLGGISSSLTTLKLKLKELNSSGLKKLKDHQSLCYLFLDYWQIVRHDAIQYLTSLTRLELYKHMYPRNTPLFDPKGTSYYMKEAVSSHRARYPIPDLSSLTNLRNLKVKSGLRIQSLPASLKELSLNDCVFPDADLRHLKPLSHLEQLVLYQCDGVQLTRKTLRKHFPKKLRRLTVTKCLEVKELRLSSIVNKFTLAVYFDKGLVPAEKIEEYRKKYPYMQLVDYPQQD